MLPDLQGAHRRCGGGVPAGRGSTGQRAPGSLGVLRVARERRRRHAIVADSLAGGALVHEFQEEQLEAYTSPHQLDGGARGRAAGRGEPRRPRPPQRSAPGSSRARPPRSPVEPCHVRTERYDRIAERFGIIAREQLTCGCHVHVSVTSAEEAVGVLDRIRVWLPVLLALSANSPFWQGHDTGYASFRNQVLGPLAGVRPDRCLRQRERYREVVDEPGRHGVILDEAMLYFDARCSRRYPTVEIRMPDVCLDVSDAVLVAALCRALVDTSAEEWSAGGPPPTDTDGPAEAGVLARGALGDRGTPPRSRHLASTPGRGRRTATPRPCPPGASPEPRRSPGRSRDRQDLRPRQRRHAAARRHEEHRQPHRGGRGARAGHPQPPGVMSVSGSCQGSPRAGPASMISPLRGRRPPKVMGTAEAFSTSTRSMA